MLKMREKKCDARCDAREHAGNREISTGKIRETGKILENPGKINKLILYIRTA